jgi:hypothetical protein
MPWCLYGAMTLIAFTLVPQRWDEDAAQQPQVLRQRAYSYKINVPTAFLCPISPFRFLKLGPVQAGYAHAGAGGGGSQSLLCLLMRGKNRPVRCI